MPAESHGHAETRSLAWKADNRKPIKYSLLLPRNPVEGRQGDALAPIPSHWATVVSPPPPLPRQLAKVYWEQVIVPRRARSLGADLLLIPYWAAPLWQPAPTVVTVHDLIPSATTALSRALAGADSIPGWSPFRPGAAPPY